MSIFSRLLGKSGEKAAPRRAASSVTEARLQVTKTPRSHVVESIEITPEFRAALELFEGTTSPIFVTGNAGTGKSTLLRHFRSITKKNVVVVAPTGMAAINVKGVTIHSFFKFPPRFLQKHDIRMVRDRADMFRKLNTLIIDEASMVRADLLDAIDTSLRLHRASRKPFGGTQVILFGDIGQLPPVVTSQELREYFSEVYPTPYFFSAKALRETGLQVAELTKIFRQSDPAFISVLNRIRRAEPEMDDLITINERYQRPVESEQGVQQIILSATNKVADTINHTRLAAIPGQEFRSTAVFKGKAEGKNFQAEKDLRLRNNAQIMMVKNRGMLWVNGTIGTVAGFEDNCLRVKLPLGTFDVSKETWEVIEYTYNRATGRVEEKVVGTFEQFPVRLAWAITIHKSQGQSFDQVVIDIGSGAFAHGQLYVALSRCRTLDGITMRTPVAYTDLCFDQRVRGFIDLAKSGGLVDLRELHN